MKVKTLHKTHQDFKSIFDDRTAMSADDLSDRLVADASIRDSMPRRPSQADRGSEVSQQVRKLGKSNARSRNQVIEVNTRNTNSMMNTSGESGARHGSFAHSGTRQTDRLSRPSMRRPSLANQVRASRVKASMQQSRALSRTQFSNEHDFVVQQQGFLGNCKTIYGRFPFEPQDELIRTYFRKAQPGDHRYKTRHVTVLFTAIAKEIESQKDYYLLTHPSGEGPNWS